MFVRSTAATATGVIWRRIARSDNVIKIIHNDLRDQKKITDIRNDPILEKKILINTISTLCCNHFKIIAISIVSHV